MSRLLNARRSSIYWEARRRRWRVFAACLAAARRRCGPFVRTARRAAALRDARDRRRAADLAWRDSAFRDAAARPSRLSRRSIARDRRGDGFDRRCPAREADCALRLVLAFARRPGGGSLTPARRAFDRPIAIACFVERAPCFPSRTWWISSRTNSPACVLGALPSTLSRRARVNVSFSGMCPPGDE
jgi:hypothetical protein